MVVNSLYLTFNGEQGVAGIGVPAIFLRLAGCHLRCYLSTLGVLCDTPESLEREAGERRTVGEIVDEVDSLGKEVGVREVTLTGGDPLWNKPEEIEELLAGLTERGYRVSVETSGTLDWRRYRREGVYFVLDYKLPSCGDEVYGKNLLRRKPEVVSELREGDVVKFVVYDWGDFEVGLRALEEMEQTKARIAFGVYWKGRITTVELVEALKKRKLLGRVVVNVQLHKMVYEEMFGSDLPTRI